MKTKLLMVLLAVSLAFNLAVIITFGHHWIMKKCCGMGPEPSLVATRHKFKKMLNLTDQQSEFMEKARKELHTSIDPLRAELQKNREELFSLVDQENADTAKIDHLIGDMSAIQLKIEKAVINHSIMIKKNMTPEQRGKFKEFIHKKLQEKPGSKWEGLHAMLKTDLASCCI